MNLKKTGIAIAMAAMMMSGAVLASGGGHGGGHGGGGTDIDLLSNNGNGPGHDNNDITTNNGHDDNDIDTNNGNDDNQYTSNNGNDNNDNNNNGAGNDNNTYTSNDGNDGNKWKNSANTNDGNDDNTWRNSNNLIDASHNLSFEVDMVLAKSDLDGHISNTSVEYGESASMGYHGRGGCNKCAGAGVKVNNNNTMTGFNNAAGITTVGQSAGANSMVQQSVVTNATVQTN